MSTGKYMDLGNVWGMSGGICPRARSGKNCLEGMSRSPCRITRLPPHRARTEKFWGLNLER